MTGHDVPDSTDWLSTPLTGLAAVENALRCQVCKDFFKTPMITSCSHTFCSLCIRRALSNDSKCPLCRASEQELKLRSNWSMEEAVEAFVKTRVAALELARKGGVANAAPKRKAGNDHHESDDAPEGKRLRTSTRLRRSRTNTPSYTIPTEENEVVEVSDDDDYEPEPEDGLVACPVCQSRMKEWQVFKHLETCTGPTPTQRKVGSNSSSFSNQQRKTKAPERLPAINYSMYKEQALRKKLADLGISNQGPRILLERRHKEWVTLWNANCDAAKPKKRGELLHDLDIWERTQGGRAPTTGRAAQNAAIIKDKDFDGAAWAAKHDDSFKDLIASARKTRLEAKKKAEEAAKESNSEPPSTSQEKPSSSDQTPSQAPSYEQPTLSSSANSGDGSSRMPTITQQGYPNPASLTAANLPAPTTITQAPSRVLEPCYSENPYPYNTNIHPHIPYSASQPYHTTPSYPQDAGIGNQTLYYTPDGPTQPYTWPQHPNSQP
ncbi:E3 ubiquitin-protein ligase rad18 [Fusarium piperis]|uniref:Postreplication repair E3 ubiquitin-protein ligase RAD18 n=1 Tax=Fusarium piperis TaxID=1435070 RepID=A0A9W8WFI4_9HYPO|nr:E3 ubiquitin-protein ligase rad18 [Fusarium piperis]